MFDATSLSTALEPMMVIALTCLMAIGLVTFALMRAWHDWIELKLRELEMASGHRNVESADIPQGSIGAARIELADMKERIRKLEAIASGVEL